MFNLFKSLFKQMIEIRVFEKGLDYAPFQNKVTEPELRSDFKKS